MGEIKNNFRIWIFVFCVFFATAMSSGEGAEEAAKDAADIATFFKSGKRGSARLWDIVCALAPVEGGW